MLTVADVDAEYLTASFGVCAHGDQGRMGAALMVDACFDVGRIKEHLRKRDMAERPLSYGCELTVEARTDP